MSSVNFNAIKTFIEMQDVKADFLDRKIDRSVVANLIGLFKPELHKLINFIDAQIGLLREHSEQYLPRLIPASLQEVVGKALPVVSEMKPRLLRQEIAASLDKIFACPCLDANETFGKKYIPSANVNPQVATLVQALLVRPLIEYMDDWYSCLYELDAFDALDQDAEPDWLNYKPEEAIDLSEEFDDVENRRGEFATLDPDEKLTESGKAEFMHSAGFNAAIIARTLSHMDDPLVNRAVFDELNKAQGLRKIIRFNILENFDFFPNDHKQQEELQKLIVADYDGLGYPSLILNQLASTLAKFESLDPEIIHDEFLRVMDNLLDDTVNPDNAKAALTALTRTRLNSWLVNETGIFQKLIDYIVEPPEELVRGDTEEARFAYADTLRLYAANTLSRFQFFSDEHFDTVFNLLRDGATVEYGSMIILGYLRNNLEDKERNTKVFNRVTDLILEPDINPRTLLTLFKLLGRMPINAGNSTRFNEVNSCLQERLDNMEVDEHTQKLNAYTANGLRACFIQFASKLGFFQEEDEIDAINQEYFYGPRDRALAANPDTQEGLQIQSACLSWLDLMGAEAIPEMYEIIRVSTGLTPLFSNYIHDCGNEALDKLLEMLNSNDYNYNEKLLFVDNIVSLIYDDRCLMNANLSMDLDPDNENVRKTHDQLLARFQGQPVDQESFERALAAVIEFATEAYQHQQEIDDSVNLDEYFYTLIHPLGNRAKPVLLKYTNNADSQIFAEKMLRELGYLPKLQAV